MSNDQMKIKREDKLWSTKHYTKNSTG